MTATSSAGPVNMGIVHDMNKRLYHRLVAATIRRDPGTIERAKARHAELAERYSEWSFYPEWSAILALPPDEIRRLICSRDPEMNRLRISSPFLLADAVPNDYDARVRRMRAARRVAERACGLPLTPKRAKGRKIEPPVRAGGPGAAPRP